MSARDGVDELALRGVGRSTGDLYLHLLVQLPKGDDAAEAIAALELLVTDDVRAKLTL